MTKREADPTIVDEPVIAVEEKTQVIAQPSTVLPVSSSLELTLFSRLLSLHGPGIRRMLNIQYRANEKIMQYPSIALYHGNLLPHDTVKNRKLSDLTEVEMDDEEEAEEPVVFIDTAGSHMYERQAPNESSRSNENEANLVLKHVESLVRYLLPLSLQNVADEDISTGGYGSPRYIYSRDITL